MANNFADWLVHELETREWSQADLARHSSISTSQITRILNGQRNAGEDTARAIAKAFKLPPEEVFRVAGILPQLVTLDKDADRIVHEVGDLTAQEKEEVLAFIHMKKNLRKRK